MKKIFATILAVLMFLSTGAYATESLKSDLGLIQKRVKALHLSKAQKNRLIKAIKHRDLATAKAMLKLSKHDIKVLQKVGKQKLMKLSRADHKKLFGSKAVNAHMLSTHEQAKTQGAFWGAAAFAIGVAIAVGVAIFGSNGASDWFSW